MNLGDKTNQSYIVGIGWAESRVTLSLSGSGFSHYTIPTPRVLKFRLDYLSLYLIFWERPHRQPMGKGAAAFQKIQERKRI